MFTQDELRSAFTDDQLKKAVRALSRSENMKAALIKVKASQDQGSIGESLGKREGGGAARAGLLESTSQVDDSVYGLTPLGYQAGVEIRLDGFSLTGKTFLTEEKPAGVTGGKSETVTGGDEAASETTLDQAMKTVGKSENMKAVLLALCETADLVAPVEALPFKGRAKMGLTNHGLIRVGTRDGVDSVELTEKGRRCVVSLELGGFCESELEEIKESYLDKPPGGDVSDGQGSGEKPTVKGSDETPGLSQVAPVEYVGQLGMALRVGATMAETSRSVSVEEDGDRFVRAPEFDHPEHGLAWSDELSDGAIVFETTGFSNPNTDWTEANLKWWDGRLADLYEKIKAANEGENQLYHCQIGSMDHFLARGMINSGLVLMRSAVPSGQYHFLQPSGLLILRYKKNLESWALPTELVAAGQFHQSPVSEQENQAARDKWKALLVNGDRRSVAKDWVSQEPAPADIQPGQSAPEEAGVTPWDNDIYNLKPRKKLPGVEPSMSLSFGQSALVNSANMLKMVNQMINGADFSIEVSAPGMTPRLKTALVASCLGELCVRKSTGQEVIHLTHRGFEVALLAGLRPEQNEDDLADLFEQWVTFHPEGTIWPESQALSSKPKAGELSEGGSGGEARGEPGGNQGEAIEEMSPPSEKASAPQPGYAELLDKATLEKVSHEHMGSLWFSLTRAQQDFFMMAVESPSAAFLELDRRHKANELEPVSWLFSSKTLVLDEPGALVTLYPAGKSLANSPAFKASLAFAQSQRGDDEVKAPVESGGNAAEMADQDQPNVTQSVDAGEVTLLVDGAALIRLTLRERDLLQAAIGIEPAGAAPLDQVRDRGSLHRLWASGLIYLPENEDRLHATQMGRDVARLLGLIEVHDVVMKQAAKNLLTFNYPEVNPAESFSAKSVLLSKDLSRVHVIRDVLRGFKTLSAIEGLMEHQMVGVKTMSTLDVYWGILRKGGILVAAGLDAHRVGQFSVKVGIKDPHELDVLIDRCDQMLAAHEAAPAKRDDKLLESLLEDPAGGKSFSELPDLSHLVQAAETNAMNPPLEMPPVDASPDTVPPFEKVDLGVIKNPKQTMSINDAVTASSDQPPADEILAQTGHGGQGLARSFGRRPKVVKPDWLTRFSSVMAFIERENRANRTAHILKSSDDYQYVENALDSGHCVAMADDDNVVSVWIASILDELNAERQSSNEPPPPGLTMQEAHEGAWMDTILDLINRAETDRLFELAVRLETAGVGLMRNHGVSQLARQLARLVHALSKRIGAVEKRLDWLSLDLRELDHPIERSDSKEKILAALASSFPGVRDQPGKEEANRDESAPVDLDELYEKILAASINEVGTNGYKVPLDSPELEALQELERQGKVAVTVGGKDLMVAWVKWKSPGQPRWESTPSTANSLDDFFALMSEICEQNIKGKPGVFFKADTESLTLVRSGLKGGYLVNQEESDAMIKVWIAGLWNELGERTNAKMEPRWQPAREWDRLSEKGDWLNGWRRNDGAIALFEKGKEPLSDDGALWDDWFKSLVDAISETNAAGKLFEMTELGEEHLAISGMLERGQFRLKQSFKDQRTNVVYVGWDNADIWTEDNDCDGQIDEGGAGETLDGERGSQNKQSAFPKSEAASAKDNDCDGQIDEGHVAWWQDIKHPEYHSEAGKIRRHTEGGAGLLWFNDPTHPAYESDAARAERLTADWNRAPEFDREQDEKALLAWRNREGGEVMLCYQGNDPNAFETDAWYAWLGKIQMRIAVLEQEGSLYEVEQHSKEHLALMGELERGNYYHMLVQLDQGNWNVLIGDKGCEGWANHPVGCYLKTVIPGHVWHPSPAFNSDDNGFPYEAWRRESDGALKMRRPGQDPNKTELDDTDFDEWFSALIEAIRKENASGKRYRIPKDGHEHNALRWRLKNDPQMQSVNVHTGGGVYFIEIGFKEFDLWGNGGVSKAKELSTPVEKTVENSSQGEQFSSPNEDDGEPVSTLDGVGDTIECDMCEQEYTPEELGKLTMLRGYANRTPPSIDYQCANCGATINVEIKPADSVDRSDHPVVSVDSNDDSPWASYKTLTVIDQAVESQTCHWLLIEHGESQSRAIVCYNPETQLVFTETKLGVGQPAELEQSIKNLAKFQGRGPTMRRWNKLTNELEKTQAFGKQFDKLLDDLDNAETDGF